jgi:SAM-dependent methyltransferase
MAKVGLFRRIYRKLLYAKLDNHYAKLFAQKRKPRNGKKVLDVGCGFGFELIQKFLQGYDCYGIDIDKRKIRKLNEVLTKHNADIILKVANAEKIPFKSNFFDEVICSHVIEHVENDEMVLKEIFRVLKKGGILFLRVPNVKNLHTKFRTFLGLKNRFTDKTHLREYELHQIIGLLKKIGFTKIGYKARGFFLPVGLRFFQLVGNYVPIGKIIDPLGKVFKNNCAEFVISCRK